MPKSVILYRRGVLILGGGSGLECSSMLINRLIAPLTAATVALLSQAALADLLIKVDKSAQHMTVTVNGEQLYDWPVSTGGRGYDTPSGNFKPFRMEIDHYSEEWDNAPMPYSIFFTKTGDAVHGTYEQRNLGHAMSHGCVRLSVKNAATLWKLVKGEKMANTTVVLSGAIPDAGPPAVARSKPLPLTTDDQRSHALPQDQRPYNDGPPQLPFPFFFGR
jgi:L,D-transpeptidase catalytic domain